MCVCVCVCVVVVVVGLKAVINVNEIQGGVFVIVIMWGSCVCGWL